MNWLMIAGGLAGVCLVTAFVWVIIDATYDEAYRIGVADGRDYAHFGEMRPRERDAHFGEMRPRERDAHFGEMRPRETARETGVINSPEVIDSPSENVERKGK